MPKGGTPPSPVEWEPCEPKGLQGVACQQRTPTLPGIVGENAGPVRWDPWANPPHMSIPRVRQTRWEIVYWRPDGTFAGAIGYKGELLDKCLLSSNGRNTDSTYALQHTDDLFVSQSFVIAGKVGEPPSFARGALGDLSGEKVSKTYYGTSNWLLTYGGGQIHSFPWGEEEKSKLVYSPAQHWSGLPGYPAFGYKDDYFIKVSSSGKSGWLSWTPETGVRDLLIQPVTSQRGFPGFNTDGQDIVFTYGEDATKNYLYSRYTLVRATYSTDPAKIAQTAVAVANVPEHTPSRDWAVGCGYAVMGAASEKEGVSLVVVRLSDGQLWRKWPTDPKDFGGIVPVAVTCQELFIQAGFQGRLQRIPLDSLGPGEPSPPQVGAWPF
jgi:hypothetical protein